jgi:hypothetical protein
MSKGFKQLEVKQSDRNIGQNAAPSLNVLRLCV